MAAFTLSTHLPLVLVVFLVAAQTIQRRVAKALQILMAGTALDHWQRVCVAQWETSAFMLEAVCGRFPVLFVVAVSTSLAEAQLVLVFLGVAAVAVFRSFFEQLALVAILALRLGVFSHKGKALVSWSNLGMSFQFFSVWQAAQFLPNESLCLSSFL